MLAPPHILAVFHGAAAVGLATATAMHTVAGSPPVSIVLFAVAACLNLGLACWHGGTAPRGRDVERRPATAVWPLSSPVWIVEPYADRRACWGCGLELDGEPHSLTGLRLCGWCRELYDVDRDRQRRERDRPWPGLIL